MHGWFSISLPKVHGRIMDSSVWTHLFGTCKSVSSHFRFTTQIEWLNLLLLDFHNWWILLTITIMQEKQQNNAFEIERQIKRALRSERQSCRALWNILYLFPCYFYWIIALWGWYTPIVAESQVGWLFEGLAWFCEWCRGAARSDLAIRVSTGPRFLAEFFWNLGDFSMGFAKFLPNTG